MQGKNIYIKLTEKKKKRIAKNVCSQITQVTRVNIDKKSYAKSLK